MIISHPLNGNKIPNIFEGKVVGHDTSVFMGVKIWIPGLHDEKYLADDKIDKLPTAKMAAPLFGNCDGNSGMFSYPEIGTIVFCFCIDGDMNSIVYFAADYEKMFKSVKSSPVLKLKFAEKDCIWMKQGPGQIILRTPTKMTQSDSSGNSSRSNEATTNGTRTKVIEIFSGEDVTSEDENAASICLFSNNDIEIRGQNVSIAASKSINLEVNEDLKSDSNLDTDDILSTMPEEQRKFYNSSCKITLGSSKVYIGANKLNFYSRIFSCITSTLKNIFFSKYERSLDDPISLDDAIEIGKEDSLN